MSNSKELKALFNAEVTEKHLDELKERYPTNLVMDMTEDENLKAARKMRTERNKLTEAIDRRRKDLNADIKSIGDNLIDRVTSIYDVVVIPFEVEDKKRKDEAARLAKIKREKIQADRKKLDDLKGFIGKSQMATSQEISGMMDALENISVNDFHSELIHEAIEAKEYVIKCLSETLTVKLATEQVDRENVELKAELAELKKNQRGEAPEQKEEKKEDIKNPVESAVLSQKLSITTGCTKEMLPELINTILDLEGVTSVDVI